MGTLSFVRTRAPQTWPYMLVLIPQQGVYGPNSPWTCRPNMAGTYHTGSKLPCNHNLPQGRPRLWGRQYPKLCHIRDFNSTVSRVYELNVPNSLGPTDPIWLVHTRLGPNHHKIIIRHRDAPDCGNEGTQNLAINAIFHSTAVGIWAVCTK